MQDYAWCCPLLQPVEDVIRTELLPPKFGCGGPGDPERAMLALPARLGRLGPTNTVHRTDCYDHSVKLTAPLTEQIKEQSLFLGDIPAKQQLIKQQVHQEHRSSWASYRRKPTQSIFNAKAPMFSVTCCRARSLYMALCFASRGSWLLSFKEECRAGAPSTCAAAGHRTAKLTFTVCLWQVLQCQPRTELPHRCTAYDTSQRNS